MFTETNSNAFVQWDKRIINKTDCINMLCFFLYLNNNWCIERIFWLLKRYPKKRKSTEKKKIIGLIIGASHPPPPLSLSLRQPFLKVETQTFTKINNGLKTFRKYFLMLLIWIQWNENSSHKNRMNISSNLQLIFKMENFQTGM